MNESVNLLQDNGFVSEYKMIGMHICMGDHKVSVHRLCEMSLASNVNFTV